MRALRQLWMERRFDESAELLRSLPLSPEVVLLEAQQTLLRAHADGAGAPADELRPLIRSAVEADPTNTSHLLAAAQLSFDAQDYRYAQEYLRRLHRQSPVLGDAEQAMLAYLVGMLAWWAGQVRQAEEPLRLAVKLEPTEVAYRLALDRYIVGRPFSHPAG